jgi:hypothetical protein
MPPAGFESAVPASERPQTDTLDRAATGIDAVTLVTRIERRMTNRLPRAVRAFVYATAFKRVQIPQDGNLFNLPTLLQC